MRQYPFRPTGLDERARFVWMWVEGLSVRMIAQQTGTSVTTVYRWIRRWQQEGHVENKTRSGRPRLHYRGDGSRRPQAGSSLPPTASAHDAGSYHCYYTPAAMSPRYQDDGNHVLPSSTDPFKQCSNNHDFRFTLEYSAASSAFEDVLAMNDEKKGASYASWGATKLSALTNHNTWGTHSTHYDDNFEIYIRNIGGPYQHSKQYITMVDQ